MTFLAEAPNSVVKFVQFCNTILGHSEFQIQQKRDNYIPKLVQVLKVLLWIDAELEYIQQIAHLSHQNILSLHL